MEVLVLLFSGFARRLVILGDALTDLAALLQISQHNAHHITTISTFAGRMSSSR